MKAMHFSLFLSEISDKLDTGYYNYIVSCWVNSFVPYDLGHKNDDAGKAGDCRVDAGDCVRCHCVAQTIMCAHQAHPLSASRPPVHPEPYWDQCIPSHVETSVSSSLQPIQSSALLRWVDAIVYPCLIEARPDTCIWRSAPLRRLSFRKIFCCKMTFPRPWIWLERRCCCD